MEIYLAVHPPGDGGVKVGLVSDTFENQHFLRAADPNRPIRFSVGEPGRRSTIWRLWAGKHKNDVYLASRKTAGIFKVSLHESGDWRLQWVKRDDSVHYVSYNDDFADASRIMHQWVRPNSRSGWTDALSIWVPGSEVVPVPGDTEPYDDVQWIQAAPEGWAVEFRVTLLKPSSAYRLGDTVALPGSSLALVNGFILPSDEVVVLLAHSKPMTDVQLQGVERCRRESGTRLPQDFDTDAAIGPRSAVITADDDGHRNIWDLAL